MYKIKSILIVLLVILTVTIEIQADELSPSEKYCNKLVYGIDYGKNFSEDSLLYQYAEESVSEYVAGFSSAVYELGKQKKKHAEMNTIQLTRIVCQDALDWGRKAINNGSKVEIIHEGFFLAIRSSTSKIILGK